MEKSQNLKSVGNLLDIERYRRPVNKHQHEFQEICEELAPIFGKGVWTLPYKPWCDEYKLRTAAKIAVQRGKKTLPYLIGIIKKL